MWFDPHAELAKIAGQPSAIQVVAAGSLSQVSRVSQGSFVEPQESGGGWKTRTVKNVVTKVVEADPGYFDHGVSVAGRPLTWTGRVVSLAEWRNLTEWERQGQTGRSWCGVAGEWIKPEET